MLKSNIVKQLEKIVGKDFMLTAKEDLATYAYDGTTTWSHRSGCGRPADHDGADFLDLKARQ